MENVLTALIVLFIILFAALTLTFGFISAQDTIQTTWQTVQANSIERSHIDLKPVSANTSNNGTSILINVHNDGTVKLADFRQWDVIVQYFDNSTPSKFRLAWMPYVKSAPANDEWTISGIYQVAEDNIEEAYDLGILNPGEQAVLQLQVSPPIAAGAAVQVTISTSQGISGEIALIGNYVPRLDVSLGMTYATGGTSIISNTELKAVDEDDNDAEILYTIISSPQQGMLNFLDTFTQADIDNGLLAYEHTGSGDDSFSFKISDGKDTSPTYTFSLTENEQPILVNNFPLVVNGIGTWQITPGNLSATDPDTTILQYQIVVAPIQGTLTLSTFTQDDIDNGMLQYVHTGINSDAFQFTVSDGDTVIGPFVFMMTG